MQHHLFRPVNQTQPHRIGKDQRRIVQVAYLQQLPDHRGLEHRADTTWRDNKSIRQQHEVMQAGEERLMFESLSDKRIDLLFERQSDADADGV